MVNLDEKQLTREQIDSLRNNIAWQCVAEWIEGRKDAIKNRLLVEKEMLEIWKCQKEHEVYNNVLNKIKNLGRR